MGNLETLKIAFDNIDKIKIFEERVIEKETGEESYVIFDISIDGDKLIAQHEALTQEEADSDLIPFKSVDLDDSLSIDENFEALYAECLNGLISSDFYELPED